MSKEGWFLLALLIGLLAGAWSAWTISDEQWRERCAERGAAYYHPHTGEWTWALPEKISRKTP